jgi:hypothetical protein
MHARAHEKRIDANDAKKIRAGSDAKASNQKRMAGTSKHVLVHFYYFFSLDFFSSPRSEVLAAYLYQQACLFKSMALLRFVKIPFYRPRKIMTF